MSTKNDQRLFKEPNIINFPEEIEITNNKPSVYELLMKNNGDYKKVSRILDEKIEETNQLINDLTTNVKNMPDDIFEKKLKKLKSDNLETMFLCDEFRKITARKTREEESCDLDGGYLRINGDNKKCLYDKPPIPKFHKEINNHSIPCFSEPGRNEYGKKKMSWMENEENHDDQELAIRRRERQYKREAAMDRLTRPRSTLSNSYEGQSMPELYDPDALVAKWRHKVTVPQPFQMTIRDDVKQKHMSYLCDNNGLRKSRTLLEFEIEKAEKEFNELEESKKQFKANPVPAHVYMPMYSSMQEEATQKRQLVREYSKELLKSIEKPFTFYKRDLEKQKSKSEVSSEKPVKQNVKAGSSKLPLKSYHGERQKTVFRAKPIPKYSVETSAIEKMKEDDLYRQIKIEMRSKKLLEESKLPGNMEERQRRQEEKRQRNEKKEFQYSIRQRSHSADSSRQKKAVPDFSKIHQRWEEEIRMSYKEPHVTQTKPFNLLTDKRPSTRSSTDPQSTPQSTGFLTSGASKNEEWNKSILAALEMAKPSTNKSTMLRENATRNKLMDQELKMQQKEIEKLSKKKREDEVAQMIRKSMDLDVLPKTKDKHRQRVKQLRVDEEKQKEDYQQNLEEMQERIKQRHLLLESVPKKFTSFKTVNDSEEDVNESRRNGKFMGYDERNHFGDTGSYHSSTEASSTIVSRHSPHYDDLSQASQ